MKKISEESPLSGKKAYVFIGFCISLIIGFILILEGYQKNSWDLSIIGTVLIFFSLIGWVMLGVGISRKNIIGLVVYIVILIVGTILIVVGYHRLDDDGITLSVVGVLIIFVVSLAWFGLIAWRRGWEVIYTGFPD